MVKYQAVCKLHPDFQAEQHTEYADAVADIEQHNDEQHKLDVITIEDEA